MNYCACWCGKALMKSFYLLTHYKGETLAVLVIAMWLDGTVMVYSGQ